MFQATGHAVNRGKVLMYSCPFFHSQITLFLIVQALTTLLYTTFVVFCNEAKKRGSDVIANTLLHTAYTSIGYFVTFCDMFQSLTTALLFICAMIHCHIMYCSCSFLPLIAENVPELCDGTKNIVCLIAHMCGSHFSQSSLCKADMSQCYLLWV